MEVIMRYAVDSKQMKLIDDYSIKEFGIPAMELMERAAGEVAEFVKQRVSKEDRILAVCGIGNNGGDGVAASRILSLQGYRAAILFIGDENKCSEQMKAQLNLAKNAGVQIENSDRLAEYNIIIDAVFGVGLSRPVTGEYEEIIRRINEQEHIVYAVDIPSGISADDGKVMNVAVRANYTITFGYNKIGLLLYPGAEYAGEIHVAEIGFPKKACEYAGPNTVYYQREDLQMLPKRKAYSHKGSYGRVLVIAGSKGMAGAAILSARAAYRSGAGLVKVVSSESNRIIIQTALPEAMFGAYDEASSEDELKQRLLADLSWASAVVIGPGIGRTQSAEKLLDMVIHHTKGPLILDADAISLLGKRLDEAEKNQEKSDIKQRFERLEKLLNCQAILTPHLMELSRLSGVLLSDITDNMIDTVRQCSYNSKLIHVVKDARTIVASENNCYINVSGNHGMATGGSGDVLTGIIAAFIAQGMAPYAAACLAVYVHGLAGDEAARMKGAYSMMAGDIVGSIEKVLINQD
jgi:hydroxyethylthiazole kinase-like uncharacterized protein yjeF